MEKTDVNHELLQEIQEKVNVDLDQEITLYLMKCKNKNVTTDHLIDELSLESFEEELYENYLALQVSNKEETARNEQNEAVWQNITEDDNYEEFLRNLSKSPFLTSDILDMLLKIQYVDTKQKYWPDISMKLQDCFSCLNHDLFLKSLKIHFKIISAQNSCVDGYLSLLTATNKIARSNFIENFENESNSPNNRFLLCIKIILSTELSMLNSIHASTENIIEELVDNLIALFSYKTTIIDKSILVLDFVSFLDEKASWFKYLCSSGYITNLVLKKLEKYPELLNFIFDSSIEFLNSINHFPVTHIYKHNFCFLVYFFSHYENISNFIYKSNTGEEYSFLSFIYLTVYAINNHVSPEIQDILTFFVRRVFEENLSLINQEILEILFSPFENIMRDNSMKIINNNAYVFKIIRTAAKIDDKILTSGYLYNRRKYRSIFHTSRSSGNVSSEKKKSNIPQLIIDVTILMLRNYINTSERRNTVDDFVLILLECCQNIYDSHPVFLYNSITSKFILNLRSFYKALCNFNSSKAEIEKVLTIFNFFFKYYPNMCKLLNDKIFSESILSSILLKNIKLSHYLIFYNIANEIIPEDELQMQLHLVVQSFLVSAWHKYDVDDNISTNHFQIEEVLNDLLSFITGVSYNEKLIKMLISECREYDSLRNNTIAIPTILKLSVQNVRNTLETYTGLLMVKILISNLDGLVILQANLNLKENLSKVQSLTEASSESEFDFLNTDKCSAIRRNILSNLESIGHPTKQLNIIYKSTDYDMENSQRQSSTTRILGNKISPPCDLQIFLQKSRAAVHDSSWTSQMKRLFQKHCSGPYKVSIVAEIINQFPKNMEDRIPCCWPETGIWLPELNPEERIGISIIVRFGLRNQLLNVGYKHEENLALLLKQSHLFLNETSQEFDGFDWFIGVSFLICSGNIEKSKIFCVNISNLPCASLIWHKFGKINGSLWLENFLQHLDVILAENTTIYTALKMANSCPAVIVKKWLSHCFFNILDFKEICNFIIFSVLHPLECSLYYMLCLFKHNKNTICTLTHTATLENLLNVISLEDFKLHSALPVINQYTTKYRNIIKL